MNVWLGFILYLIGVVFLPVEVIYAQSQLNRAWRAEPDRITRLSAIEVAGPGARCFRTLRQEASRASVR